MNLFNTYKKKIFKILLSTKEFDFNLTKKDISIFQIDLPPANKKGDISCNIALVLSKKLKIEPFELALKIKSILEKHLKEIKYIDVVQPGFINMSFSESFWADYILNIFKNEKTYGAGLYKKKKYNIEFVSANPTGPLHVGHCRGAVLGDVLANLVMFNGHNVYKEYYINDYGNQINFFTLSVFYRIDEIINKKKFPENINLYPGDYIIDIAKKIIKEKKISNFSNYEKIKLKLLKESLKFSMSLIKNDLTKLGIKHNSFVSETDLIKDKVVNKAIKFLSKKNFTYLGKLEKPKGDTSKKYVERNQLLFFSTKFGDDQDRSLQKFDGSWTYFAGDVGYHYDKVYRKYDVLINILGADHAGYVKRITSAVSAISKNKTKLICKICQLVKLFKNKKPFKMSKRKGDYITVSDLLDEVGKDSVRFIMLNRSNDVELDFDFEKVTEKSKDNPVFYVQYAYARICSIFRILDIDINRKINLEKKNLKFNEKELEIIKKISEWPKCVEKSFMKLEPHRIPVFLYDLVTLFHSYWNSGKEYQSHRFITNGKISSEAKLALLKSLSIVIKNGMSILGVSCPTKM